ncbi:MAG: glycosyltransferase family 4 protein [bacterium]|nr:glycosyltransferase family 4 protein [bacterium]
MEKKSLKIAFLSMFNGIVDRGVETLVMELSERLAKNHVITVFQSGDTPNKNYNIVKIPTTWTLSVLQEPISFRRRLFLDRTSLAIKEFTKKAVPILKKEKYDIVVPWNNGWQSILVKFSGVGKFVASGQAGLGWDDRLNLLLFPNCFAAMSAHQVEWAKRKNPFVKIVSISNGVDTNVFKPEGEKIKTSLAAPVILCAAAFVPVKRQDLIIKALSKLDKGSLLLVGKGERQKELQEMGNNLLPGRFQTMSVPYSDMHKVYRSCDIFTFPTDFWESFGIVLLEAMATNKPIVASDDPIRREIVGDAGLFVDPENTVEYAAALQKALDTDWGDKPRKQAEKFSWDKIAKQYEDLFTSLVK